jgi:hypothetical protein
MPSAKELTMARFQGKHVAGIELIDFIKVCVAA